MGRFVMMGVSGCGKSTVGAAVAKRRGLFFMDGDALHPEANIAKMSSGQPLNDEDRAPWLADIGKALAKSDEPIIIGCSALKRKYRDWIRAEVPEPVYFVHLDAPKEVLAKRVAHRPGHFMPASLLDSQFEALEPLEQDELGHVVDISKSFAQVVAEADAYIRETLT